MFQSHIYLNVVHYVQHTHVKKFVPVLAEICTLINDNKFEETFTALSTYLNNL